jgi:hypothetical protein
MAGFFSVRLAPGVRVSASSRGLRAHVGPRGARLHVGGGRTGVSTGAGPFTYYESLSGSGGTSGGAYSTGPSAAAIARADKARQAQLITEALTAISNLHRHAFRPATRPVAHLAALPPFGSLLAEARLRESTGLHWWQLAERSAAKNRARAAAELRARELLAAAQTEQGAAQKRLDEQWEGLLANEPAVVLETLRVAFEDNEAPVAAVGVEDDEVALVVLVPGPEVLPDRYPTTTEAGNLSLRRTTKTLAAGWYRQLVAGHAVVSAKEAFAVCPGLRAATVVVLRDEGTDVYGGPRARPILATRLSRDALEAVRWECATAFDVVEQTGRATLTSCRGPAQELQPIDLGEQPDLARVAESVDLEELVQS